MTPRTNCEDILLNFVAAAAIREQQAAAGATPVPENAAAGGNASSAAAQWPPHVVWAQPSRRLDVSFLSGVGLSRSRASHKSERRR